MLEGGIVRPPGDPPVIVIVAPFAAVPTPPEMLEPAAERFSEKVFETPAALAVRTAVWDVDSVAATVAEKLAVVAPAGTVTLAGTVTFGLLLERATANPPVGAALFMVTVHAETAAAPTVEGVQVNPLKVDWVIESVLPVPTVEIELPPASDATTPAICIGVEVCKEPDAMVNVALASAPLPRIFKLGP
jgi:hypothetical protein